MDSGTPDATCGAKRRRKGSLAALREFHGRRNTEAHTSTVSHDPEKTAFMASTMANIATGLGFEKWVTSGMPSDVARNSGPGAPGSARETTPLISDGARPASRIALVEASRARASGERSLVRRKPVLPTPTMATWSLIGLRLAGVATVTPPPRRARRPGTVLRHARSTRAGRACR